MRHAQRAYDEGRAEARRTGLPYSRNQNPHPLKSDCHLPFMRGWLSVGNTCSHASYTTRQEDGDRVTTCDRCGKQVERPMPTGRESLASVLHANKYLRDGRY